MSSENHRFVIRAIILPFDDIVFMEFSVCAVITNINDFRLQIRIFVIFQPGDDSQPSAVYLVDVLIDYGVVVPSATTTPFCQVVHTLLKQEMLLSP